MVDTNATTQDRASRTTPWVLGLILAVAAIIGWFQYHSENSRRTQLESTIQNLEQDQVALQTDLTLEQEKRQQTQNSLIAESEALANLKQSLAAESAVRANLKQSLAAESAARANLKQSLAAEKESAKQLQSTLQQSQQERQRLESELQQSQLERQRLESELHQEVSRLAAESAELEQELQRQLVQQESLNDEIGAANADRDQLSSNLEQAQHRRQQLLDQIASVSDDIEAKEGALTTANQGIQQLNLQLDQAKQDQGRLETRVAQLSEQQMQEAAHFEALRQRLEQELNESRVEITQMKNRMTVINLTSEVLFNSGSASIKPGGRKVLDLIATSLNAYPNRAISIEGHTDNVPIGKSLRYVSNWDLSAARALAAVDHLQRHNQVSPERLRVVGHGEFKPVASNDTDNGRQLNRRIEIRLLAEPGQ